MAYKNSKNPFTLLILCIVDRYKKIADCQAAGDRYSLQIVVSIWAIVLRSRS